jgi:2-phospho-L-lactate transferase/gluconeogenesis factor (CofD/UPF0052 family)
MGGIGAFAAADAAHQSAAATARGDDFQAFQEHEMFLQGMTKSFQTDTAMTQHLTSTIANIEAVRASSGASVNSPSGDAIQNRTLALGNQDIARETSNIQQQAQMHIQAMGYYTQASQDAIQAGDIAASGAILGGIGSMLGSLTSFIPH